MPNRVPLIKPKSLLPLFVLALAALVAVLAALSVGLENVHAQSTAPTISTVAITSSPGSDNTYATGDTITVSVTFSEAVIVDTTGGTPYVRLSISGPNALPTFTDLRFVWVLEHLDLSRIPSYEAEGKWCAYG